MFLEPKGRNWGSIVNWDDLGKIYAAIVIAWTLLLLFGICWLVLNRRLPFIRFRNLPLAVVSTSFLHVYLIKICLAYTTNGHFLCSAEYWIMSIYLPFGIALFQAYLVQLRSLWEQQQRLVSRSSDGQSEKSAARTNLLWRWRNLSSLRKSYCVIGFGMLVQLIITAVLYATTPTLQGDWSSFGDVTHAKGQALCRKSLPWIPSAFWQLFWSWIYGPYTLYQVRNIHDIHFWRAQVVISVLSGLPGSPLWLAALYCKKFKPINIRFVPPMWLAPGIMVMQFVTIFFPLFEGWQSKHQMRQTLSILEAWEKHSPGTSSDQSLLSKGTSKPSIDESITSRPSAETRINTMASLRKALEVNPAPLLDFAATKDFTAENVLFLIRVRRWRAAWASAPKVGMQVAAASVIQLYNAAVAIYVDLVNDQIAEFAINIESKIKAKLDQVFESAVPKHGQLQHSPTPFDLPDLSHVRQTATSMDSGTSKKMLWDKASTIVTVHPAFEPHFCIEPLNTEPDTMDPRFDEHVFDEAERSIEYLVLTNTWQKFVKDRAAERIDDVLTPAQSP